MSTPITPIQHFTGSSSQHNKARRGIKSHTDQKGWNKTVRVCRWHDCLRRKSQWLSKKSQKTKQNKNLTENKNKQKTTRTNSKFSEYKINKNQLYFYILSINTWKSKLKIKWHLNHKRKEERKKTKGERKKDLLVINLPKHVQNFYVRTTKW